MARRTTTNSNISRRARPSPVEYRNHAPTEISFPRQNHAPRNIRTRPIARPTPSLWARHVRARATLMPRLADTLSYGQCCLTPAGAPTHTARRGTGAQQLGFVRTVVSRAFRFWLRPAREPTPSSASSPAVPRRLATQLQGLSQRTQTNRNMGYATCPPHCKRSRQRQFASSQFWPFAYPNPPPPTAESKRQPVRPPRPRPLSIPFKRRT